MRSKLLKNLCQATHILLVNKFIRWLEWLLNKLPISLSHNTTKVIYNGSDNGHNILVYQNLFFRWLNFGGPATQSKVCKLYKSAPCLTTTRLLSFAGLLFKQINHCSSDLNIILLGLGGGDLLRYYVKIFKPLSKNKVAIFAIEKSATVIDIAKKYFYLDTLNNIKNFKIKLINEDAFKNITTVTSQQYQIINADLFTKLDSTLELKDDIYIENLYNKLASNGILAINILVSNEKYIYDFITHINMHFNQNIIILSSPRLYNTIVFAFKNKDYLDFVKNPNNKNITDLYIKNIRYFDGLGYFADLD